MNTQIILEYNSEIYYLDLNENFNLNLNYQAGDIRKVLTRNSSYSKTVSIPGTAANNLAFKNLYDVTNISEFNPFKKSFVKVITNGQVIFSGYLKLDSVKNTDGLVSYECTMFSDVASLFTNLESRKLSELDFTKYTHTYNYDAITGSWETFIYENNQTTPFQFGNGYVYPFIDWGVQKIGRVSFPDYFFKPSLYAKTVWDEIFFESDYNYESEFINSDYFKSLIVTQPGKTNKVSEADLNDSKARALVLSTSQLWSENNLFIEFPDQVDYVLQRNNTMSRPKQMVQAPLQRDYAPGGYDNGLHWDESASKYVVNAAGRYKITWQTYTDFTVHVSNLTTGQTLAFGIVFDGEVVWYGDVVVRRNGVDMVPPQLQRQELDIVDEHHSGHDNAFIRDERFYLACESELTLLVGDEVYLRTGYEILPGTKQYHINNLVLVPDVYNFFYIREDSYLQLDRVDAPMVCGDLQDFDGFLGEDTQKDFILSIAKMFNLYFYIDNQNPKLLHIEPRSSFYDNSNVLDWNYKLNYDQEVELTPTSEFETDRILFTYKEDSDYYNKKYKDETKGEIYSQYRYDTNNENDFIDKNSEDKIDVIFAPGIPALLYTNINSGLTLTSVYKYDEENGRNFLSDSKIRILFYNGLIDSSQYRINTEYFDSLNVGTVYIHQRYAWAGIINNPHTPDESLEWAFPKNYYYVQENTTNSNLFTKFWEKFLIESFDKTSKILTGYFYLTDSDIFNLNFKNIIYLKGRYWTLNKIIDWNPNSETTLTKVELLLLINYNNPTSDINAYQQTIVPTSGEEDLYGFNMGAYKTDNQNLFNFNGYKGIGNLTSNFTTSTFILGDGNGVGALNSALILGNNNRIAGGNNSLMVVGNNFNVDTNVTNALIVGNTLSSTTYQSNSINVNNINLIPDESGNTGTITINGIPIVSSFQTGETVGLTIYIFSGLTQLNGRDFFVDNVEVNIAGYNYSNYKAYAAKLFGGFKASGQTLVQIVNETDLWEKSDFSKTVTSDIITDGAEIYVSVTGDTAETIVWKINVKETII